MRERESRTETRLQIHYANRVFQFSLQLLHMPGYKGLRGRKSPGDNFLPFLHLTDANETEEKTRGWGRERSKNRRYGMEKGSCQLYGNVFFSLFYPNRVSKFGPGK